MRTTLESGAWIEHVPIQDLKGKHKRDFDRAGKPKIAPGAVDSDGSVDVGVLLAGVDVMAFSAARADALWAIIITGWSYDVPVPQHDRGSGEITGLDEALEEIPLDDYEEIGALLARFMEKLDRRPDPKQGITSSSNGSSPARAGGSRKG